MERLLASGLALNPSISASGLVTCQWHRVAPDRSDGNDISWAGCECNCRPTQGLPSVEVLFTLMARTDDEDQFRRTNVEPQDVTRGAKRDDQFAKCRA